MASSYFSYLVRIWNDNNSLKGSLYVSIEEPSTKKIYHFKTLEELFDFLANKVNNIKITPD